MVKIEMRTGRFGFLEDAEFKDRSPTNYLGTFEIVGKPKPRLGLIFDRGLL